MSFAELTAQSHDIDAQCISQNTRKLYDYQIHSYVSYLASLSDAPAPYPITEATVRVYLTYRLQSGKSFNTIKADLAALRWAVRQTGAPDPTQSATFRNFMNGLRRHMGSDRTPHEKKPMTPELLTKMAERVTSEDDDKRIAFLAVITTAFAGFLRCSEILALRVGDVEMAKFATSMTLRICSSKTDHFQKGELCKIMRTNTKYCAVSWMALYLTQKSADPEERLFDIEPQKLRKKLRKWLIAVGVSEEDAPFYSTHSCRAGGATTAAKNGIQDSVIQRHGRWRSTCFMKYTRMERTEAGEIVTIKL